MYEFQQTQQAATLARALAKATQDNAALRHHNSNLLKQLERRNKLLVRFRGIFLNMQRAKVYPTPAGIANMIERVEQQVGLPCSRDVETMFVDIAR